MEKGTTLFLFLIFAFVAGDRARAQTDFDRKLNSLYRHTVPLVRPSGLKQAMGKGENVVLLDARTMEEYTVSHLPSARYVGFKKFDMDGVQQIDKDAMIVVYCTVGYRSEKIGEKLLGMGFTHVKNLYGGILQWANEGLPLLNGQNEPTDSVHTYSRGWGTWLQRGTKVY